MLHLVVWLLGVFAWRCLTQCPLPPEFLVTGAQSLDPTTSVNLVIPVPNSGDSYASTLMLSDQPVFSGYFDWEPSVTLDCDVGPSGATTRATIIFGVTNHLNINS